MINAEEMEFLAPSIINKTILSENNVGIIVNEIVDIFNTFDNNNFKQEVLNYLNNHNITLQEFYNWLINNQNDSNVIVILGEFNYFGIGTSVNEQTAFKLWQKAANLGNTVGTVFLGNCYQDGTGTSIDKQKAFELYQKAANLGNSSAQRNLAFMYENEDEIVIRDIEQAIHWYKKSADQEDQD